MKDGVWCMRGRWREEGRKGSDWFGCQKKEDLSPASKKKAVGSR